MTITEQMMYLWVHCRGRCDEVDRIVWEPVYDAVYIQPIAPSMRGLAWMKMNA